MLFAVSGLLGCPVNAGDGHIGSVKVSVARLSKRTVDSLRPGVDLTLCSMKTSLDLGYGSCVSGTRHGLSNIAQALVVERSSRGVSAAY
jgi:hypothetical protein